MCNLFEIDPNLSQHKLRKEVYKETTKMRKCLQCDKEFLSLFAGHRKCMKCKHSKAAKRAKRQTWSIWSHSIFEEG
jgi:hypothetical protein